MSQNSRSKPSRSRLTQTPTIEIFLAIILLLQIIVSSTEARLFEPRNLKKDKEATTAKTSKSTPTSTCTLGTTDACPTGYFCQVNDGSCGSSSGSRGGQEVVVTGTCTEMSHRCTKIFRRVCGCDGILYANACLAAANGVNLDDNFDNCK